MLRARGSTGVNEMIYASREYPSRRTRRYVLSCTPGQHIGAVDLSLPFVLVHLARADRRVGWPRLVEDAAPR